MQSFVVLGIIPGTNFQTTFNFWLTVAVVLLVFAMRKRIVNARHVTQRQLAMWRIARAIERCDYRVIAI